MADDIVKRLRSDELHETWRDEVVSVCCDAADEIERLREQVAEMLTLMEDIVIGERIRERAANDNGRRTSLGEVAADFGIDLHANEMGSASRSKPGTGDDLVIDRTSDRIDELAGAREALNESRQISELWERAARQIDL